MLAIPIVLGTILAVGLCLDRRDAEDDIDRDRHPGWQAISDLPLLAGQR